MARLTRSQVGTLLDGFAQLYSPSDLDDFPWRVIRAVRSAVPADFAVYDEIDVRRRRHRWVADPPDLDLSAAAPAHESFFQQHPFVLHLRRTGDMPPLRLSDLISRRRYHETGFYREAYRKFGVEYQLGFTLPAPSPSWCVGFAINRSRCDFSDEERAMLELLRPHLLQAYRNAEVVTRSRDTAAGAPLGSTAGSLAILTIDARGRLSQCPPRVRQWLVDYFGQAPGADGTVPDALRRWLNQHGLPGRRAGGLPALRTPLVLDQPPRRLTIRMLGASGSGQTLLIEERRTTLSVELLRPLGLTVRQTEILMWVAQGKTNPEIGRILGLSHRTVDKHTEHVFARLCVETRTAAARRAWEIVIGQPLDAT